MDEIWEALEATTINKDDKFIPDRANANKLEINQHKATLLRFLDELDGSLSVSEVREALEQYHAG